MGGRGEVTRWGGAPTTPYAVKNTPRAGAGDRDAGAVPCRLQHWTVHGHQVAVAGGAPVKQWERGASPVATPLTNLSSSMEDEASRSNRTSIALVTPASGETARLNTSLSMTPVTPVSHVAYGNHTSCMGHTGASASRRRAAKPLAWWATVVGGPVTPSCSTGGPESPTPRSGQGSAPDGESLPFQRRCLHGVARDGAPGSNWSLNGSEDDRIWDAHSSLLPHRCISLSRRRSRRVEKWDVNASGTG